VAASLRSYVGRGLRRPRSVPSRPDCPNEQRVSTDHALKRVDAANTLENIAHSREYTENIDPKSDPSTTRSFTIKKNRIVNVTLLTNAVAGALAYDESEVKAEKSQSV